MTQRRLVPDYILVSSDRIHDIVASLGAEVTAHCSGELLVVGVLKGSFIFLADLVRHISRPLEVDFIAVSSYHSGVVTSGTVTIRQDTRIDPKGRHVILVEDIVDSGLTIEKLTEHFLAKGARRVTVVALLTRGVRSGVLAGEALRSDTFVLGYGLDHHERYRGLPDIWSSKWIEVV